MKKLLSILLMSFLIVSCKGQQYPLNTFFENVPQGAYLKDLNHELDPYEGMWTANWNGKVFFIELKKVKKYFTHLDNNPYYMDVLIGKFKVTDSNGQVLFDNTSIPDNNAKVVGGKIFSPTSTKYSLRYIDPEICGMNGLIMINFTDSTKTKLNWKFSDMTDIITVDCQYYNTNPFPQPLPKNIILTKQ